MLNLFKSLRFKRHSPPNNDRQKCQSKPSLREEKKIDGRPVRFYVDGSIKAATSDGWKRFYDFEEFQAFAAWRKIRLYKRSEAAVVAAAATRISRLPKPK